jgi:uncharacterized membrane protein YjfL (UPF0719 family)
MSNVGVNIHFRGFAPFVVAACILGFFSAFIFYEADVFWQDTGFVFGASLVLCMWGLWRSKVGTLHHLYLRGNAAIGAARLGVVGSVAWCGWVLFNHADPTITGIWTVLYAAMAFAAIKLFGQFGAELFGPRLRVDIYERKNLAAGLFVGAFTLSTGLIFGGAMWGSMDGESLEYGWIFRILPGYEDGWWITPWFFLMGWFILYLTMRFWFRRENSNFRHRIVRERRLDDAWAASCFCIACAITIAYAVQGDYLGFWDSLLGFSIIAVPILAHEALRPATPEASRPAGEGWIYIVLALVGILTIPWLGRLIGLTNL